jgi:hypothetical protein
MRFRITSRLLWLHLAYWVGIVLDARAALYMWFPEINPHLQAGFAASLPYRFAMAYGAALMAGWTALLFWADRKPVERRFVLVLTVCPVIAGLTLSRLVLTYGGKLPEPFTPASLAMPVALTVLFLFAYFYSFGERKAAEKPGA